MINKDNYFPHIDGLRAIAIISVFIYHYYENILPSGYLGVDIFFVISGFVISGYLSRTKPSSWYQYLIDFYVKRIKRLLPALLFCVLASTIAIVLFTTRPSPDIFRTGAASLFGLSNIFLLLRSSDYFSLDSSLNPFTQTWSLGVEEQFYIFYPILIFTLGLTHNKNNRVGIIVIFIITIVSFLSFLVLHKIYPISSFYLLPTRAWELGIGSLVYFMLKSDFRIFPKYFPWLALTSIIVSLLLPPSQVISATLLSVFGTAVLINSCQPKTFIYNILTLKPLMFIGLISYSLYLWHWSILVLGKLTIGTFGLASLFLVFLTITISIFSYYAIERPLRYRKWFPSKLLTIGVSISIICMFSYGVLKASKYSSSYNNLIASSLNIPPVAGWGDEVKCHGAKAVSIYENPFDSCLGGDRTNVKPRIVYLIGDSHAAQLTFMFNKALLSTQYSLRFVNLEDQDFPQNLFKKNRSSSTLDYIVNNIKKEDILAISFHRGRLNPYRDKHIPVENKVKMGDKALNFFANMSRYISLFERKNVKTLFIKDTPLMKTITTIPSCLMQIKLFGKSTCRVNKNQDLHTRKQQDEVFDNLARKYPSSVCIWDPAKELYMKKSYFEVIDERGNYVMWDWNHITKYTSEKLSLPFLGSFNTCINK